MWSVLMDCALYVRPPRDVIRRETDTSIFCMQQIPNSEKCIDEDIYSFDAVNMFNNESIKGYVN